MWQSEKRYLRGRVAELEKQLAEERAHHRYREDWLVDMRVWKQGMKPPPPQESVAPVPQSEPLRQVTDTDIAKYEAIKDAAASMGKSVKDPEVQDWIRVETGWGEADIHKAIHGQG
jgi:hypothetical protein